MKVTITVKGHRVPAGLIKREDDDGWRLYRQGIMHKFIPEGTKINKVRSKEVLVHLWVKLTSTIAKCGSKMGCSCMWMFWHWLLVVQQPLARYGTVVLPQSIILSWSPNTQFLSLFAKEEPAVSLPLQECSRGSGGFKDCVAAHKCNNFQKNANRTVYMLKDYFESSCT
jgi:hypothetical protein